MRVAHAGLVTACVLAGACGRIGFDGLSDGSSDAPEVPADAAACVGAATRVPIDTAGAGTWVEALRAAATESGFSVTYVAPDQNAFALTYTVSQGVASAITADTSVEPNNAVRVGSASLANTILVVSEASGATRVRPYSGMLNPMGAGMLRPGRTAVDRSVVESGDHTRVVLLTTGGGSPAISAAPLTAGGADAAAAVTIIPAAEAPGSPMLVPGAASWIALWFSGPMVRAAVLDGSLATVIPPTTIPTSGPAFGPTVAWAARQNSGLVVWKHMDGRMMATQIDAALQPIGAELQLATTGVNARVASDGNSFWVVWHDPDAASMVSGAHITAGGMVQTFLLPGSGGMEVDHDVVTLRDGTVQILWFERNQASMLEQLVVTPGCTVAPR